MSSSSEYLPTDALVPLMGQGEFRGVWLRLDRALEESPGAPLRFHASDVNALLAEVATLRVVCADLVRLAQTLAPLGMP